MVLWYDGSPFLLKIRGRAMKKKSTFQKAGVLICATAMAALTTATPTFAKGKINIQGLQVKNTMEQKAPKVSTKGLFQMFDGLRGVQKHTSFPTPKM